jgi:proline dehydrogenase
MNDRLSISFENTENAFAYKSNDALKKAHWLFRLMGKNWLVSAGTRLTPLAIRWRIPFTRTIIKSTIFEQFIGGETLQETKPVVDMLAGHQVQVILDYGVEGNDDGDVAYDHAMEEFIRVIDYAATQPNIPFMSVKVTGFARFGLLEKLQRHMHDATGTLMVRYAAAQAKLDSVELAEWKRVVARMERITEAGQRHAVGVLVDAEETWIQDPVDAMVMDMMDRFNRKKAVIYNTAQLYRHDRYAFLEASVEAAKQRGFILGMKLVRGAYMEKERKRANEQGYPSPIQATKENTDRDFDQSIRLCLAHLDQVATIIASHNEQSNLLGAQLLHDLNIPHHHPHVHFSQLYGMSDHITFNLAEAGYSVSKYLPFGPIKHVVPYLMRRAQENSSVSGQTSRELSLLEREVKRRSL